MLDAVAVVFAGVFLQDFFISPEDMFICNYFKVISISNYDLDGTEYRVHITKEITDSFKEWIRGTGMINVDDWEV